jgi:hypothetical protein
MGALLSLPQDITVPLAGVAAVVLGCFIICYCSWLECRLVDREKLRKQRLVQEKSSAKVGGQLVFGNRAGGAPPPDPSDAPAADDDGVGVFAREPVYLSATPGANVA